jgi:hypothetical protein
MGMKVGPTQSSHRSNQVQFPTQPIGLNKIGVDGVNVQGKNPVVTLGGNVNSRSNVEVQQVRVFPKTKEVFITVGTSKREKGMKGQTDPFTRDVALTDISVKKGAATGEQWSVKVTNGRKDERPNDILASGSFTLGKVKQSVQQS